MLGCAPDELDAELDALQAKAKAHAHATLRVDAALRERARTGRYAYVHERGADFAAGIWVVDPVFMLDAVRQALAERRRRRAGAPTRPTSPAPASTRPTCATPPQAERERRHEQRQRQAEAVRTNLGLGHDLRAGLLDPSPAQLDALRAIVCHLLARDYRDVIAYGAGWTDPERQRPVGETGRHEPHGDRRDRRRRAASARSPSPTRCAASPRSSPAAPPRSCSTPTASRAPRCSAANA